MHRAYLIFTSVIPLPSLLNERKRRKDHAYHLVARDFGIRQFYECATFDIKEDDHAMTLAH